MIERIAWGILAMVHVTPALALFAPSLLTRLYGVQAGEPLYLLMHHRAALFFAVLVICIWCTVDQNPRKLSVVALGISMLSFLMLYWINGFPLGLRPIAVADLIGLPALAFAGWKAFAT